MTARATLPSMNAKDGYRLLHTSRGKAIAEGDFGESVTCLHLSVLAPGSNERSDVRVALAGPAIAGVRLHEDDDTVDLDLPALCGAQLGHGVSHHHFALEPSDEGLLVMDLGSLHGLWLDDYPLCAGRVDILLPGQELVVGGLRVQVVAITRTYLISQGRGDALLADVSLEHAQAA